MSDHMCVAVVTFPVEAYGQLKALIGPSGLIEHFQILKEGAPTRAVPAPAPAPPKQLELPAMPAKPIQTRTHAPRAVGETANEIVLEIITEAGGPMHINAIGEKLAARRLSNGKSYKASTAGACCSMLTHFGKLVRVGEGLYQLPGPVKLDNLLSDWT